MEQKNVEVWCAQRLHRGAACPHSVLLCVLLLVLSLRVPHPTTRRWETVTVLSTGKLKSQAQKVVAGGLLCVFHWCCWVDATSTHPHSRRRHRA